MVEGPEPALAEVVVAVQRGDRRAFAILYARFRRVVHALALARVPAGDADDVVQEVFAEVWARVGSLREPAAFPGWVVTMARSRAIDAARRGRGRDFAVGDRQVEPPPRAEAVAALAAIRALSETYRETLIMRLVEGLTGPEIAERTGMTPESVRVHLHRGMTLLRERLGGGGEP
ncbi:MAG: sigma-70 family RNA polymerase sigma factor [Myxococcota bacterium]